MMKPDYTSKAFIGAYGEKIAARYLLRHGYLIKDRNYRDEHREIDLIAVNFHHIIFVEVKTRTYREELTGSELPPSHAVNAKKRYDTRKAAQTYLYENRIRKAPRMDVIEVYLAPSENGKKPKIRKIRHFAGAY